MFCGGLRVGAAAPEAPSVASELRRAEANDALPKQLKVDFSKRLGRGANNAVYKGTFGETSVAVRLPVTKADTQCYVRAAKEAALALKAAELHVGRKCSTRGTSATATTASSRAWEWCCSCWTWS